MCKLKLGIAVLALATAGCAGNAATSAVGSSAPTMDATPIRTSSGSTVRSTYSNAPVTGRDWNCKGCY